MKPVSGLRRAVQRGLLSLVMILLAGTVHAAPDPVLVLGRISDDPKAHYEQLQPLLDYVVARMHDVGIKEGRILMARDPQQMASYLRRGAGRLGHGNVGYGGGTRPAQWRAAVVADRAQWCA